MSQVIYARVPDALKEAADLYAEERSLTLTRATVDLMERGLAAATDESSIEELQQRLARTTTEKAQLEAQVQGLRAEAAALSALAQRVGQSVGTCPSCRASITGTDLLAVGTCPNCGEKLAGLIAPAPSSSSLDQSEFLMLLGALGAVVGVAFLSSKS
jgi:hypothetical protein